MAEHPQSIQPGFRLFTSNRMERLAARLCEVLSTPLKDPFSPETIVVQSKGMERWISLEIASRLSVSANVRFPFPNTITVELFSALHGAPMDLDPFSPSIMSWRLLRIIPGCLDRPAFETLRRYLGEGGHPTKSLQLAQRLAALFDQYLVFRPEMIEAWEAGEEEQWQAQLWRALIHEGPASHQASLRRELLEHLSRAQRSPETLPQRLSIFGISALPRFHMEVFRAVSRFTQVNLFFLNPCSEYWADIQSGRQIGRSLRRAGNRGSDDTLLHLESGNPLLASLGGLAKDFFRLIQALEPEEQDDFEDPGEASLLTAIQRDILFLEERGSANRVPLSELDRSIVLHSCHSPMREIEVLHDHLLALFEAHPELGPRDILVMTPDIHLYAPYIQAVFDAPEHPQLRIPFTITDRSMHRDNPIAEHFLSLLDLPATRFTASRLLALLEVECIRDRFAISEGDLEIIRQWVRATGIRWGIDDRDRARMGFTRSLSNTWREGMDRMLLGYAMKGDDEALFAGLLPHDAIEGSVTATLDRFLLFVETLIATTQSLAREQPLAEWRDTLTGALETLFELNSDTEKDLLNLRQVLNELEETQRIAGFLEPLAPEAIRYWLAQRLDTSTRGLGFITGGVTFCAMLPMRAIPFPVICLIGMDDGAFPRPDRKLGFDLMARAPRPGDRSQRGDDRYLFLEAILSARRQLYISHVGQSQQDNATIPPSVLVCELMDAIENTARPPDEMASVLDRIRTIHPLQPFNRAYFDPAKGDRYVSYSDVNCAAASSLSEPQSAPTRFLQSPLPEPEAAWRQVEIHELAAFFANPSRYLLTRRMHVELNSEAEVLEDCEPFVLGGLDAYTLQDRLVRKRLKGVELGRHFLAAQASGALPHGSVGKSTYAALSRETEAFVSRLTPRLQGLRPDPVALNLSLGPYTLNGQVGPLSGQGLVFFRPATIKPKDRLRLWLHHLALLCIPDLDWPRISQFIAKGAGVQYSGIEGSATLLQALLDLYWSGMSAPLHFFPETSFAYAQAILSGRSQAEALGSARTTWESTFGRDPEMHDPYIQLCFTDEAPLDDSFTQTAMAVYEPLLTHGRNLK
ncbi:MAG: exodeoxyribonuclease V subunit gamma [Syntrophobacteraceae bacterium]